MALPNLSQISEALDKIMPELTPVPVGTVAYAHEVPTGWLQCNGAEVSRTTYARLFRKIGTKYGAGNGSTTFNLPDLQHRVLEGTNTTSEVAQKVEAGLPDITGRWGSSDTSMAVENGQWEGAFFNEGKVNLYVMDRFIPAGQSNAIDAGSLFIHASRSQGLYGKASTVQPNALRLLAIIKA